MAMEDRRKAITTEDDFRTWELMTSGPITEGGLKPDIIFSTFSGEDTEFKSQLVHQGKMGTEWDGLATQDFEANTELRHSAISWAESALIQFDVMEGMDG